jgi:hypothetical protein
MELKINLTNSEHKDLVGYCNLNNLLINDVAKKSYITGFNIERYGLLNGKEAQEKQVETIIERIVEVPIEVIKEVPVEVIKEVPVEKIIIQEVIKEVPIEKKIEVIKEVFTDKTNENDLKEKLEAIQKTVQKLKQDNIEKDNKIKQYEKTISELQSFQTEKKAVFLRGSNLNDNLFK